MNQNLTDINTSPSSNISEDLVNSVYNDFSAESMKTYKNVMVSLNRNFKRRKTTNKSEWLDFERVICICIEHGFNIRCFVKWCFLNRLVPNGKGRSLKDISYLTHVQQILSYSENKDKIESLYKVYLSIVKSIIRIKNTKKEKQIKSTIEVIKDVIYSGNMGMYISTGMISRYFLSLIPNIENFVHDKLHGKNNEDSRIVDDFCNCCQHYRKKSSEAMRMFWPTSNGKSIIELCS